MAYNYNLSAKSHIIPSTVYKAYRRAGLTDRQIGIEKSGSKALLRPPVFPQGKLTREILTALASRIRWGYAASPQSVAEEGRKVFPDPFLVDDPRNYPEDGNLTLADLLGTAPAIEHQMRFTTELSLLDDDYSTSDHMDFLRKIGKQVDLHAPFLKLLPQEAQPYNFALRWLRQPSWADNMGANQKFGVGELPLDEHLKLVNIAATSGVGTYSYHITSAGRPYLEEGDMKIFLRRTRDIVDAAAQRGVKVAVETGGGSIEDHVRIWEVAGAGILFDVVHWYVPPAGGQKRNIMPLLEEATKRKIPIPVVHLGKSVGEQDSHTHLDADEGEMPDLPDFLIAMATYSPETSHIFEVKRPNSTGNVEYLAQVFGLI